jgi:entericidin B
MRNGNDADSFPVSAAAERLGANSQRYLARGNRNLRQALITQPISYRPFDIARRSTMNHLASTTRKIVMLGLLAVAIPAISACNTVKGAGKDIEKGGEAIQDGAEEVHDDITN